MKKLEFKTAIVDDEPDARGMIRLLLGETFPGFKVVCDTGDFNQARLEIAQFKPDILILDVEMPEGSGFELLEKIQDLPPAVIFVTAYDKYAIRAIKASARDYILKPVNKEEFREALENIVYQLVREDEYQKDHHSRMQPEIRKIAIPSINGLSFLEVDDIVYCEADGNYTMVHFIQHKELVSRPLARFETDLANFGFLRVHHKYLVNLNCIKTYSKGKGGGYVIMNTRDVIQVSARKKVELLRLFASVN